MSHLTETRALRPPPSIAAEISHLDTSLFDGRLFDERQAQIDDPLRLFRDILKSAHAAIRHRFLEGVPAHVLVRQRAAFIDEILRRACNRFRIGRDDNCALVAVGGYGRGELHPGSDIDLLILLEEGFPQAEEQRLTEFVTFLWDIGLEVGHSVRTVDECVDKAAHDITIATNLMEARLIQGANTLFQEMRQRTGRDNLWPSPQFFEAKWREQQQRHHRFHDTAYNLEPNVKDGPGGLRDIQVVGWVAKRHFGAETLQELVAHGFLTDTEYQTLVEEQNFLWQVRFGLHVLTGRREDRLLFDHQRALAKQFGYEDHIHRLAVEQFMKRYYRSIGELGRLNEMLLELFQEVILYADSPVEVISINRRFEARNGFLEVTSSGVFKRNPFALLELFLILEQHPELKGVRASTIRLIRDHRYLIDDKFRADLRARSLFMEILRQPRGITHELRRMHRYGILAAYLPVFGNVVGQMQYDLFHVYSVDEHSLFVVRNLRAFAVPEKYHECPLCSQVFRRLPKPELLYIAGLFHDIAKGRGGDHSELGAQDAADFCVQHGLSHYDVHLVRWLVEHHLLLSTTAQRQDIHDPDVIKAFAAKVRDRIHLDYLYLLTVADIRGTNPVLWNDWKDALLRDLYESTLRALRRGLENPIDRTELIEATQKEARQLLGPREKRDTQIQALWASVGDDYFLRTAADEVAWHTRGILRNAQRAVPLVLVRPGRGGTEIFVHASDQDYLFAATVSVLSRLHLTILDARIITAVSGMTFDSYVVLEEDGENISSAARGKEIQERLRKELQRPEDALHTINRLPKRQLKHFPVPSQVAFFCDEANNRSVMELSTSDRPGLLSRLGCALVACRVRLQNAKIATFGERAEDVFFITNSENQPLSEDEKQRLRRKILEVLESEAMDCG